MCPPVVVACLLANINELREARVEQLQRWLSSTLGMDVERVIPMRSFEVERLVTRRPDSGSDSEAPAPTSRWEDDSPAWAQFVRERDETCLSALSALERLVDVIRAIEAAEIARYRSAHPRWPGFIARNYASRTSAALTTAIAVYLLALFLAHFAP